MLTYDRPEIQNNISKINKHFYRQKTNMSHMKSDCTKVLTILRDPCDVARGGSIPHAPADFCIYLFVIKENGTFLFYVELVGCGNYPHPGMNAKTEFTNIICIII